MKLHHAFLLGALSLSFSATQAQVLNRLKQKTESKGEQKASEAIDKLFSGKKKDNSSQNQNGTNNGQQNGSSNQGQSGTSSGGFNSPSNNSGGGLISTPPDVNQNLADAEIAYKKSSYGEARYAVQQAMLGVELEIGNQILKSLPDAVVNLNKVDKQDQVTSSGFGWEGLTITRTYYGPRDNQPEKDKGKKSKDTAPSEADITDGDGKQFKVTIANSALMMSAVNMYFNTSYAQTNGGQQNWKQTKVKGYKAIIEFDQSSGYKLSVPIGQSSLIVYEGINFATEPDMMKAADVIDIDGIKKMLGEQ